MPNGSITVQASNGELPYTYDIGDGSTSDPVFEDLAAGSYSVTITDGNDCTVVVDTTIMDTGVPEATITDLSNEQCNEANGSFTVEVTGGVPPYSYDIGNGVTDDPHFDGLAAGDYIVTVYDFTGCTTTVEVTIINEISPPVSDFTYVVDGPTVFLTNHSQGGGSYLWDFGDLGVSEDENPIHVYEESGDYLICLEVMNACGSDVFCQVVTVVVPLSMVDISGNIAKENGQTVGNVTVNCTGASPFLTLIDGNYSFDDLDAGEDYFIDPVKDFNYVNGVTAFDIFLISQHILHVELLDSPYKIIAADVNNNGTVSSLDLFFMQQVILNIVDTFPNNTSWRFVPEDHVFPDPGDPFDFPFPEQILLENLDSNALDQDFVAIKVGDVNLNADPASIVDPEQDLKIEMVGESVDKDLLLLKFKLKGNLQLAAFQLELDLKKDELEFTALMPGMIHPEHHFDFIENKLNLLWYSHDKVLKELTTEGVLFEILLDKKNTDPGMQSLKVSHNSRAFDAKGNVFRISGD